MLNSQQQYSKMRSKNMLNSQQQYSKMRSKKVSIRFVTYVYSHRENRN